MHGILPAVHHRRLLLLACLVLAGCNATPADPEGTLERIQGGTIRAGFTANEPWAFPGSEGPTGVEVELIEDLAAELDAEVEWSEGSEAELVGALEVGQLDVVVGGLGADSPWSQHAAFTYPYFTSRVVVAAPRTASPDVDIAGVPVAVEANSEAAGLLEKTDAEVSIVEDVTEATGHDYMAIDDWLIRYGENVGVIETDVVLEETQHVMAVRFGENGWMVTLERHLLERADDVGEMLVEYSS